ncbi:MAG: hypothetical protein K8R36_03185 [Planctomycetales bacterium]|nr:hypothetical protein [Planctomycetales bacterium]
MVLGTLLISGKIPAQQPAKRSGYGTSRVAARPENKEPTPLPQGRGGEGGEQLPLPLTAEEKDGNKLVALAAKDVFRQKAIQAKVRQRVFAFGQEVVGAGEYYQFGQGQPKLLRLDMKMQVGPQAATLLEVCGRQDYWLRRHLPPAKPKLEHVNLTRLASALSRIEEDGQHVTSDHWMPPFPSVPPRSSSRSAGATNTCLTSLTASNTCVNSPPMNSKPPLPPRKMLSLRRKQL